MVKDDVLREVEEALLDRPWIAEPLTGDTAMMWDRIREANEEDQKFLAAHPELKSKLDSATDVVKDYVNTCVEYDEFSEYLEADPGHRGQVREALRSIRWISNSDIPSRIKEQVFDAPVEMMKEYPWIGEGITWAVDDEARELAAA